MYLVFRALFETFFGGEKFKVRAFPLNPIFTTIQKVLSKTWLKLPGFHPKFKLKICSACVIILVQLG